MLDFDQEINVSAFSELQPKPLVCVDGELVRGLRSVTLQPLCKMFEYSLCTTVSSLFHGNPSAYASLGTSAIELLFALCIAGWDSGRSSAD